MVKLNSGVDYRGKGLLLYDYIVRFILDFIKTKTFGAVLVLIAGGAALLSKRVGRSGGKVI